MVVGFYVLLIAIASASTVCTLYVIIEYLCTARITDHSKEIIDTPLYEFLSTFAKTFITYTAFKKSSTTCFCME